MSCDCCGVFSRTRTSAPGAAVRGVHANEHRRASCYLLNSHWSLFETCGFGETPVRSVSLDLTSLLKKTVHRCPVSDLIEIASILLDRFRISVTSLSLRLGVTLYWTANLIAEAAN
jgi:hypothetical protein